MYILGCLKIIIDLMCLKTAIEGLTEPCWIYFMSFELMQYTRNYVLWDGYGNPPLDLEIAIYPCLEGKNDDRGGCG